MIKLTLPYPPSVNMITSVFKGRKITSKRGRTYRNSALMVIQSTFKNKPMLKKKLKVELFLFPPTRAKRDIDNYSKAVLDALTEGGIYEDDSLIYELIIIKKEPDKNARVEIIINELN